MIFFIHNILDKLNQFFYKIENLTFDYKTIILLETMIILKFEYHINSISLKNIYKSHIKIEVKIEKSRIWKTIIILFMTIQRFLQKK